MLQLQSLLERRINLFVLRDPQLQRMFIDMLHVFANVLHNLRISNLHAAGRERNMPFV